MDIFSFFLQQLKRKYQSEWGSIYYRKPRIRGNILLAGDKLSSTALNEYMSYDTPKYFVSDSDTAIQYTRAFSVFVLSTPINECPFVFFLATRRRDAYSADLTYMIRDIINFKMRLQG